MAYGKGRSRLLRERGKEQADERVRYERQIREAEEARGLQSLRKSGWGSALSLVGGALLGPVGMIGGQALGKWIGDRGTVGGKQAEEYKVSTDVGRFGLSQKYDLEDINRQLEAADEGELWQDITDVGKTAVSAFTMGGGSLEKPGDFSWTDFGGKSGKTGMGVFNIGGRGTQGSLWNKWTGGKLNLLPKKMGALEEWASK